MKLNEEFYDNETLTSDDLIIKNNDDDSYDGDLNSILIFVFNNIQSQNHKNRVLRLLKQHYDVEYVRLLDFKSFDNGTILRIFEPSSGDYYDIVCSLLYDEMNVFVVGLYGDDFSLSTAQRIITQLEHLPTKIFRRIDLVDIETSRIEVRIYPGDIMPVISFLEGKHELFNSNMRNPSRLEFYTEFIKGIALLSGMMEWETLYRLMPKMKLMDMYVQADNVNKFRCESELRRIAPQTTRYIRTLQPDFKTYLKNLPFDLDINPTFRLMKLENFLDEDFNSRSYNIVTGVDYPESNLTRSAFGVKKTTAEYPGYYEFAALAEIEEEQMTILVIKSKSSDAIIEAISYLSNDKIPKDKKQMMKTEIESMI